MTAFVKCLTISVVPFNLFEGRGNFASRIYCISDERGNFHQFLCAKDSCCSSCTCCRRSGANFVPAKFRRALCVRFSAAAAPIERHHDDGWIVAALLCDLKNDRLPWTSTLITATSSSVTRREESLPELAVQRL